MKTMETWLRLLLMALLTLTLSVGMIACSSSGDDDDDDDDTTVNDDDDTMTDDDDDTMANDDDDTMANDDDDAACESECAMEADMIGDFSCLGANPDPDPTGAEVTLTGLVEDFQDGIPVGGAMMEVVETGATATTAANGSFEIMVPGNERVNIKITTDGGWVETWQYDVLTEAEDFEDNFVVVSNTTMTLIPGLLGVPQLPGNGAIAGTLVDCNGDEVQNAFVRPAPCNGAVVKYFVGGFPNKDQCPSSDDGLYVVLNADPDASADLTLDFVGLIDGEETVVNTKTVAVVPDGLGVLNIGVE